MEPDIDVVYRKFGQKLLGKLQLRSHVAEVVASMPEDVIDYVTTTCWFIGSLDDAWAFTFTGNDLQDHHLIFLSDELFLEDETQIRYTIAHEIGHVMLGHRNSVLVKQSKQEIARQEYEADQFAKKYL